jgi:predicted ATPase/class 3 adenylate cyclase
LRHDRSTVPIATPMSTIAHGPLVGRQREVEDVLRLLEGARLVTITGAGGSGKTRVALEVATRADPDAVLVQLAAVSDPALVAPAIAQQLGLGGTAAEEGVLEALADRSLLLCLDNFEQVVDAAPLLAHILAAAPRVRLLVTSRTSLRLSEEQEFSLAPLDATEAVEFFTLRARRLQPGFEPDDAVREICRRLDGLPLALELAAARIKLLAPAQILDRLDRRLPLLGSGARDAPERHRTLDATIDWSYRLLTAEEQALFARLSVFPGGCTLDAAEVVGGEGADTLDQLASVLDKSLLYRRGGEDEPRYRMLETLRAYAADRLADEPAVAAATHRSQVAHYLGLAEAAEAQMVSGRYAHWIAVFRNELDNLEATILWALEHDPESGLRILGAIGSRVFHLAPARVAAWLDRALDVGRTAAVPPAVAARVATTAGYVRLVVRELDRAERVLLAAVTEWERIGDLGETARARALLGTVHAHVGRVENAREQVARALAEADEAGDERIRMMVRSNAGSALSVVDDHDGARAVLEELIPLAERAGASSFLFVARVNLGAVLLRQDPVRAAAVFGAALAQTDIADTQILHAREGIAMATLLTGDAEGARRLFGAYLDSARDSGRKGEVQAAVGGLMGVAIGRGDAAAAARLAGARAVIAPGVKLPSYLERFATEAREALGEETFERLAAEGAALPLDEVLAPVVADGGHEAARRTFVFTDIVSSTQLLELIGDAAWGALVAWHDRTLRRLFASHGGEEVDHAGDGFFVSFAAAEAAVACAVSVQRTLAEHRRSEGFAPEVRVGIHTADAERRADGGYHGIGVHTAARIAASAGGGEIAASLETARAAGAAVGGEPRSLVLKGLSAPVTVVDLDWRESSL